MLYLFACLLHSNTQTDAHTQTHTRAPTQTQTHTQVRDFIREYKIFEMWPRKGTMSVGERTIVTFKYNPTHEGGLFCSFCVSKMRVLTVCVCVHARCKETMSVGERTIVMFKYNPTHEGGYDVCVLHY